MINRDIEIIELLKNDGRMSVTDISKGLDIPDTTIHYRLKKLKKVIEKYTISINYEAMGYRLFFVEFLPEKYTLDFITEKNIEAVCSNLRKRNDVIFVGLSDSSIFAVVKAKGKMEIEIPGAKMVKNFEIRRRFGNFVEP
jgi:DNA-binding Lrp family transcriptional regulator